MADLDKMLEATRKAAYAAGYAQAREDAAKVAENMGPGGEIVCTIEIAAAIRALKPGET